MSRTAGGCGSSIMAVDLLTGSRSKWQNGDVDSRVRQRSVIVRDAVLDQILPASLLARVRAVGGLSVVLPHLCVAAAQAMELGAGPRDVRVDLVLERGRIGGPRRHDPAVELPGYEPGDIEVALFVGQKVAGLGARHDPGLRADDQKGNLDVIDADNAPNVDHLDATRREIGGDADLGVLAHPGRAR